MTAPGWYPDGHGQQRWWDGRGWTHYVVVRPARRPSRHPDWWKWLIIVCLFPPVVLMLPFSHRCR